MELFFNSLCLFLICGVPGLCSNDFFHTALIIKFIHFPSCTIPLNKKLWVITALTLKVQRRKGRPEPGCGQRGDPRAARGPTEGGGPAGGQTPFRERGWGTRLILENAFFFLHSHKVIIYLLLSCSDFQFISCSNRVKGTERVGSSRTARDRSRVPVPASVCLGVGHKSERRRLGA